MGAGASMQEMEEYLASGVVGNWAAFEAKYACDLDDASKLGEGSFGVVYRCTERASGAPRAVKLMSTDGMSKFELEELHNEVLMLEALTAPDALAAPADVLAASKSAPELPAAAPENGAAAVAENGANGAAA